MSTHESAEPPNQKEEPQLGSDGAQVPTEKTQSDKTQSASPTQGVAPEATPARKSRPLIASQPLRSEPTSFHSNAEATANSSQPRQSKVPGRTKAATRKPHSAEAREWFARLRIREDRLAKLWVSHLTSRDVVVWSPKEKRWVAMLAVPELRQAIQATELDRASNPRSVAARPSYPSEPRLSRPPGSLPPAPPPPLRVANQTSTAGELRLQSIAQEPHRPARGTTETSRASRPPSDRKPTSEPRRTPDYYHSSLDEDTYSTRGTMSRWSLRAAERLLWMGSGSLLLLVLSSRGSSDEASKQFEPAKYVVAADETDGEARAKASRRAETLDDSTAPTATSDGGKSPLPPPTAADGSRDDSASESKAEAPQVSEDGAAQPALSPHANETARATLGEVTRPTTPKLKSHVPQFLRESVESALQVPGVPRDFDFSSARVALLQAANDARACPGSRLSGKAIVTFDPSGRARAVDIPVLIGDGADRDCIARAFKAVRVPQFTGGAVAVKKDF